jgi:sugar phosphate isomerase/epimerase
MSFSCPDLDLEMAFQVARQFGYSGFEPRIDAGHKHGIELAADKGFLSESKLLVEKYGISICCIATSCSFSNPETVSENLDLAKRCINLASEVNSPSIRIFGGSIPDGISREKSSYCLTESLIKLSVCAAMHNVAICMETHDGWCDPKNVAHVMKCVAHKYIGVNWDIMHPVLSLGDTIENSFEILRPWILHVHIHDGSATEEGLDFTPIGTGKIDHRSAIMLLKDMDYKGYISGEWIDWEPYEIHLPRELETLKKYEIENHF